MIIHLSTPIERLTRVGAVTAKRLANLGIAAVKDLLEHYPVRYEDYSQILDSRHLVDGMTGSIAGTITKIERKQTVYKKMKLTEAWLDDGYDTVKIIWFNQPFIADTVKSGDKIIVAGKIERDYTARLPARQGWVIKNPSYEKAGDLSKTVHTARLVPIYPATAGITQKQIRFLVTQALPAAEEYKEILPAEIIKGTKLIAKPQAIRAIHLPENAPDYEQALRRLKFEELFFIQLLTAESRQKLNQATAPAIPFHENETKELVAGLPFKLTDDQRKTAWQILQDISQNRPMNRLLQGEVGSGKTVVATIAALNAAQGGWQTAIMAPTEILAFQHYQTISNLFPSRPVALLTSKYNQLSTDDKPSRNDIKQAISKGLVDIIIGTHAIIQNDVTFHKLGLIVIDEQHRFGVEQRKLLKDKNANKQVPHLLSMTATPIPRSLALTLYGDLDISTIRQMPQNRRPIITKIVDNKNREAAYRFIKEKVKPGFQTRPGRQAFVICPLIEESDKLGVKSATQEYEKLQKQIFPDLRIGLLHGKMPTREKEAVMTEFRENKTNILVSTAVVEVGVDVPNAAIMIIEGADRFGLSQLHQFRGRVGRAEHQSYCFLFTESQSRQTRERLNAFVQARDGFDIAELDLKLRGPGQLYGTVQSGYLTDLKIAKLTDSELISETKAWAQKLLAEDPDLEKHRPLKQELAKQSRVLHFE